MDSSNKRYPGRGLAAMARGDATTLEALAEAGMRSPFDLARLPLRVLQGMPALRAVGNLARLHREAVPAAVALARGLRERRLSGAVRSGVTFRSGIQSLVEGPTYESQFSEPWAAFCVPGAPESNEGYLAYLASLYRYVTEVVEKEPEDDRSARIPLSTRRPDLASMMLDERALAPTRAIVVVNRILDSRIAASLQGSGQTVDDVLLLKRHPFELPYERYMAQIGYVLHRGKRSLGDLIRVGDRDYPYFVAPGLSSARAGDALRMDSELGPVQQEILLEPIHATATSTNTPRVNPRTGVRSDAATHAGSFLRDYYGVEDLPTLTDVARFCRATGTRKDDVESLFSIERFAPVASPNAPGIAAASPTVFGSVFINAGGKPVTVQTGNDGEFHTITGAGMAHFDRIQRMLRLSRWLDLPLDQADQVVMASIRAEQAGKAPLNHVMTELTMRSLGLFRRLRRDHGVTAEDFAALLDGPALYARGGDTAQFDRIFNRTDLYAEPIVLDGSAFAVHPDEAQRPKIVRLCSALGIGFEAYLYFARIVLQVLHADEGLRAVASKDELVWSREVIGAFYRLVRLPAYLGISGIEAVALLQLLAKNGPQFVVALVKPIVAGHEGSSLTDTLHVIHSLCDAVAWCRENTLDIGWLHHTLVRMAPPSPASLTYDELLKQIHVGLPAVLLGEAQFRDLGLPEIAGSWMTALGRLVDDNGIVVDPEDDGEAAEDELARIEGIVRGVLEAHELDRADLVQKVTGRIVDSRSAQEALVLESLGKRFDIEVDQVRQALGWVGTTRVFLIAQILAAFREAVEGSPPTDLQDRGDLVAVLEKLDVRADVIRRMKLSADALALYLRKPAIFEPAWSGPDHDGAAMRDVSFPLLFAFARYSQVVRAARQPEATLIEYLELITSLDMDRLGAADAALVRDDAAVRVAAFSGMSVWNVLETARELNPHGVVQTVWDIDRLMRVHDTCDSLGLDAAAIFGLAALGATSPTGTFRQVAEAALGAVSRDDGTPRRDLAEMGQSERSSMTVEPSVLIARTATESVISVTVRDFFGDARQGVTVRWRTNLGTLAKDTSVTGADGQATATLAVGAEMGSAEVVATFGLGRSVVSPGVVFDCDDRSLKIAAVAGFPDVAGAKGGYRESIRYKVSLKDKYGNPGSGRLVRWSVDLATPRFTPLNSTAGANGEAETSLRSLSPGVATVNAWCDVNGEQVSFEPVTFTDDPWIASVDVDPVLALDIAASVTCTVRSIDGSPLEGAAVTWDVAQGSAGPVPSTKTDARGEAVAWFTPTAEGVFQVRATATPPGMPPTTAALSRVAEVRAVSVVAFSPDPSDGELAIGPEESDIELTFHIVVQPAIAGLPVDWTFDGKTERTPTTSQGRSAWTCRAAVPAAGRRLAVSARVGPGTSKQFDIVVKPDALVVTLHAIAGEAIAPSADEDDVVYIGRGLEGRIKAVVRSKSGFPVHNATVALQSGQIGEADSAVNWNITTTPALGVPTPVDAQGEVTFVISTRAAGEPPVKDDKPRLAFQAVSGDGLSEKLTLAPALLVDAMKAQLWSNSSKSNDGWVFGHVGYLPGFTEPAGSWAAYDLVKELLVCLSEKAFGAVRVYAHAFDPEPITGSVELVPTDVEDRPESYPMRFVRDARAMRRLSVPVTDGTAPVLPPWH
ncbi:MAG: Tc toxin subunit A [Luteibacter sp.]